MKIAGTRSSARVRMLVCLAAASVLLAVALPASAFAATFDPLNVIPYETFRASSSMSIADIQAFLATQSGPLKSLNTYDWVNQQTGARRKAGQPKKSAARIIYEAAQRWNLNPKVIISTLQKEESLITVSNSSNASRLRKAMGCGIYSGSKNTYSGFGNQVWNGTRKLSTYELPAASGGQLAAGWKPGTKKTVALTSNHKQKKTIVPKNASTFALYTYTPYYPQCLVWNLYVRFFGDPQAPPRMRPVYRFRNRHNGTYYYTASESQRYTLVRKYKSKWTFQGTSFKVDTSATANATPLYELYNTKTHAYVYTTWAGSRDNLLKVKPKQWRYNHIVARVSHDSKGAAPVYRLQNKASHASVFTTSLTVKRKLTSGKRAAFRYEGISFRLAASVPTTPAVGPSALTWAAADPGL